MGLISVPTGRFYRYRFAFAQKTFVAVALLSLQKTFAADASPLSVDLENDTAIKMYQKLGFQDYEVVGTSKTMIYKL